MPHVIVEHSANISLHGQDLLKACHEKLVALLPTELESCKGRLVCHDHYLIGDGNRCNAFVHIAIKALAGRDEATLARASEEVLAVLKTYAKKAWQDQNVQLSVDITELSPVYRKCASKHERI